MKINVVYPDLLEVQHLVYDPYGFVCSSIVNQSESKDYSACIFRLNNKTVLFRTAKITPTKIGQFVTLWKRVGNSPIMPYDASDPFDLVIFSVRHGKHVGHFVFPKDVLVQKGFVSHNGKGGKRAMRVYSPWDMPDNQQGKKSQAWQILYFVEVVPLVTIDKLRELIGS